MVRRTAKEVLIPFVIGGGIGTIEQINDLFAGWCRQGFLNTSAVENPDLISEGARIFGRQCIVVAIDALWSEEKGNWEVYTHGGRKATGLSAAEWAARVEELGAGEILLTSMNADGGRDGFDIPLNKAVAERVTIPVIASGGAGAMEHFFRVLTEGKADAALAASVFHYRHFEISELKKYLRQQGVEVRIT